MILNKMDLVTAHFKHTKGATISLQSSDENIFTVTDQGDDVELIGHAAGKAKLMIIVVVSSDETVAGTQKDIDVYVVPWFESTDKEAETKETKPKPKPAAAPKKK